LRDSAGNFTRTSFAKPVFRPSITFVLSRVYNRQIELFELPNIQEPVRCIIYRRTESAKALVADGQISNFDSQRL